jgi:hypothetical protein
MSDERADLILNLLRAIRAKLNEHDLKFDEVITRLGRVERDVANLHGDFAGMQVRHDWSTKASTRAKKQCAARTARGRWRGSGYHVQEPAKAS